MTHANNKQLRERKQRRERVIELDDETINDYPPLDAHEAGHGGTTGHSASANLQECLLLYGVYLRGIGAFTAETCRWGTRRCVGVGE